MTLTMQNNITGYSLDEFLDFIINNIDEKELSKDETKFLIRTFYDKYCREDKSANHHKCKLFFENLGKETFALHRLFGEDQAHIVLSKEVPLFFGIILIVHEDRHEVQRLKSYLLDKNKDKIEYINLSSEIEDNCYILSCALKDCRMLVEKTNCLKLKAMYHILEKLFDDMDIHYCNYYGSYPFEIDAREVTIKFFEKLYSKYPNNKNIQSSMEYLYRHNDTKLNNNAKYYERYSMINHLRKAKSIYFEMSNYLGSKELENLVKCEESRRKKRELESCILKLQMATESLKETLKNATIFCEKHKFNESVVNEMLFINEVFDIVNKEEDKQVKTKSKKMIRQQKLEDYLYKKNINKKIKTGLAIQKKKLRKMEQEKQEFLNNYSKF